VVTEKAPVAGDQGEDSEEVEVREEGRVVDLPPNAYVLHVDRLSRTHQEFHVSRFNAPGAELR
jgi:hypothetical protein